MSNNQSEAAVQNNKTETEQLGKPVQIVTGFIYRVHIPAVIELRIEGVCQRHEAYRKALYMRDSLNTPMPIPGLEQAHGVLQFDPNNSKASIVETIPIWETTNPELEVVKKKAQALYEALATMAARFASVTAVQELAGNSAYLKAVTVLKEVGSVIHDDNDDN